jgi:hypothetical protein
MILPTPPQFVNLNLCCQYLDQNKLNPFEEQTVKAIFYAWMTTSAISSAEERFLAEIVLKYKS